MGLRLSRHIRHHRNTPATQPQSQGAWGPPGSVAQAMSTYLEYGSVIFVSVHINISIRPSIALFHLHLQPYKILISKSQTSPASIISTSHSTKIQETRCNSHILSSSPSLSPSRPPLKFPLPQPAHQPVKQQQRLPWTHLQSARKSAARCQITASTQAASRAKFQVLRQV